MAVVLLVVLAVVLAVVLIFGLADRQSTYYTFAMLPSSPDFGANSDFSLTEVSHVGF